MARAATRPTDESETDVKAVMETITYIPGPMDPPTITWCGLTFNANVPKDVTGDAAGTEREKLHATLIERARDNKHFRVGSSPRRRMESSPPKTADEYRSYFVEWLKDPVIQHADQLIARFAKDRELQLSCEVGSDDYSYLSTLFMPKLHDLARGDELTEQQVANLWLNHGIMQLPW